MICLIGFKKLPVEQWSRMRKNLLSWIRKRMYFLTIIFIKNSFNFVFFLFFAYSEGQILVAFTVSNLDVNIKQFHSTLFDWYWLELVLQVACSFNYNLMLPVLSKAVSTFFFLICTLLEALFDTSGFYYFLLSKGFPIHLRRNLFTCLFLETIALFIFVYCESVRNC